MKLDRIAVVVQIAPVLIGWTAFAIEARGQDQETRDQVRRAITYLDGRQDFWAGFSGSGRGEGADRTTCVSCHTGVSYAWARAALGRFVDDRRPSAPQERAVDQVTRRVEHWAELDSPRFRLSYDHDTRKKIESRGTEAVLDAWILAADDRRRGLTEPSPATRKALTHLWETQEVEGTSAGSWAWLNFGLEPWEGDDSRAFGASLAALAAASAPGYLIPKLDEPAARGVDRLRDYLRRRWPDETTHNRLWILEASLGLPGLITPDQARETLDRVRASQRDDGGWALASLGDYQRVDGSSQSNESDGYATGLALHALGQANAKEYRPSLERGLAWLRSHQRDDGSWPGFSVNKQRDPSTLAGQLMTHAASAFAARALIEMAPH